MKRLTLIVFLAVFASFIGISKPIRVNAQPVLQVGGDNSSQEAVQPKIIYYGKETTSDALKTSKLGIKGLYCAQIITPEIVKRGYFDAHYDSIACYNSDAEAIKQRNSNVPVIRQYSSPNIAVPLGIKNIVPKNSALVVRAAACGGNRGTMFQYVSYSGAMGDVCSSSTYQHIGGITLRSVWLVGGSCAAITVKTNEYPWPNTQYVNFSSIAYQFLYVRDYTWTPPC